MICISNAWRAGVVFLQQIDGEEIDGKRTRSGKSHGVGKSFGTEMKAKPACSARFSWSSDQNQVVDIAVMHGGLRAVRDLDSTLSRITSSSPSSVSMYPCV